MTFLASSAIDDTAFAWACVLTLPAFYFSSCVYIATFAVAMYALIKRYVHFLPILVGAFAPPALAFGMVACRNGPGWLYLLLVVTLPVVSLVLLGFFVTAGRRFRVRRPAEEDSLR